MLPKDRLIVALDSLDQKECFDLIEILSPEVETFKVGIAPFTAFGGGILSKIEEKKKKVFLDLKFHDIPNTVKNASRAAAAKGVHMMNFHCSGGVQMMREAAAGADEGAKEAGTARPVLLGVTVLTSMSREDLGALGISGALEDRVLSLARMAKEAGLDGVVASARETRAIKKELGKDFIVVTPGVRPAGAAAGDQKRTLTPKQAVENGADYIVVGRPIIHAEKPARAARQIIEEIS